MRYLYSIIKLWKYRNRLKAYLVSKDKFSSCITNMSSSYLEKSKIKALILDFDGVLNSHGELEVKPEVKTWLNSITSQIKSLEIFILSNKPNNTRKIYFANNFSNIKFVAGKRKKPYPDGLEQIAKLSKIDNKQHMLIADDRLATGILAAEIFGCKACLISKPYIQSNKRPFIESFFTD